MTAGELERLGDYRYRYDLIRGRVHRLAPAGGEHGEIAGEVAGRLWAHVAPRQLGRVYGAETGFLLARDPDVVLAPDAAFVRADRLPPRAERRGFLRLAPDLAVEIVSPSEREADVAQKVREYLAAGVRLVWVLYPLRRTVLVYEPGATVRTLRAADELDGGDVLPEFRVRVADLFA